jgi:thiosulfate/3-mercaptopyruvate sulfurtransferase
MTFTTLIDVASLRELRGPRVVLDCRFDLKEPAAGRQAYLAAHIPGARYADLEENLAAPVTAVSGRHPLPAPDDLARYLVSQGIDDAAREILQVIAYDAANGSFAARAWWLLRWLGWERVAVLDGGFDAWRASGASVESGAPPATAGAAAQFTVRLRPGSVATADEVLRNLRAPGRLLVDARAPERFSGQVEPLDPVAGHVPGAVNQPFAGNLQPDGRFLAAAQLRRRWLERLGDIAPADSIAMCGSGVTACHNLLAMAHAGLPGAKLYAGSWSEWIRDPNRPVARGDPP